MKNKERHLLQQALSSKTFSKGELLALARQLGFAIEEGPQHTELVKDGKRISVPGHGDGNEISPLARKTILTFLGLR